MQFQFWLVHGCSEVVGDSLCLQGARAQTFWRKKGTWRKRRELRGVQSISGWEKCGGGFAGWGAQRRLREVSELALTERDGLRIRKKESSSSPSNLLNHKKDMSIEVLAWARIQMTTQWPKSQLQSYPTDSCSGKGRETPQAQHLSRVHALPKSPWERGTKEMRTNCAYGKVNRWELGVKKTGNWVWRRPFWK